MKIRTKKTMAFIGGLPLIVCLFWMMIDGIRKNPPALRDLCCSAIALAITFGGFACITWLLMNWKRKD